MQHARVATPTEAWPWTRPFVMLPARRSGTPKAGTHPNPNLLTALAGGYTPRSAKHRFSDAGGGRPTLLDELVAALLDPSSAIGEDEAQGGDQSSFRRSATPSRSILKQRSLPCAEHGVPRKRVSWSGAIDDATGQDESAPSLFPFSFPFFPIRFSFFVLNPSSIQYFISWISYLIIPPNNPIFVTNNFI